MRKLTSFTTLIFSLLMFSSTGFADWTEVSEAVNGTTYYVDFERIKKHGGYVYFWALFDLLKPDKDGDGDLSYKVYSQGDCKLFRYMYLSTSFHKEPMGGGSGKTGGPETNWRYPPPDSVAESGLKSVCRYAN